MKHYETHLYAYAYFVADHRGEITDVNRAKMRAKCLANGHTEGECQMVEACPQEYINDGFKNPHFFNAPNSKQRTLRAFAKDGLKQITFSTPDLETAMKFFEDRYGISPQWLMRGDGVTVDTALTS